MGKISSFPIEKQNEEEIEGNQQNSCFEKPEHVPIADEKDGMVHCVPELQHVQPSAENDDGKLEKEAPKEKESNVQLTEKERVNKCG
ncbi:hypothetical protein IV203_015151 [Nitzschia inconspicua]|uniref:Uncharacterized protein n=1 Tax=Nitzschia inconspicua TaxID=303405 RepID=A0A9K3LAM0_9STRA|nr:hypothetical protein IV203_015151 [Nitzschia inconspicua]